MRSLFCCVILLHLIFWVSCTGSPRSREVKEPESPVELLSDSSLTDFDFEGSWHWFADDDEASVSMKILSMVYKKMDSLDAVLEYFKA